VPGSRYCPLLGPGGGQVASYRAVRRNTEYWGL